MSTTSSKGHAEKLVRVFVTGDLSQIDGLVSETYLDHQGLGGRPSSGRKGFAPVVTAARQGLGELIVEIVDMVAEGELVAMRLRWSGERPDGYKVHRETLELLRFENGLATEHWGAGL